MGLIMDLLTLPLLGAPRLIHWLGTVVADEAERELLDEGHIWGELLKLGERLEAGEIDQEGHDQREGVLLERLEEIRKLKARASGPG